LRWKKSKGNRRADLRKVYIVKDTPLIEIIAFPDDGISWKFVSLGIGVCPFWLLGAVVV
jgi:hypothetical protein